VSCLGAWTSGPCGNTQAALEVLGLDLRILTKQEEDIKHKVVVVGIDGQCLLNREAADVHGEHNGEVE